MAKTTCVGWICSFIRYHLGNQALQSKAAGRSCDQGGRLREAVGKETESPPRGGGRDRAAKNLRISTHLSDPPGRMPVFYNREVWEKRGLLLGGHSLKADQ